MAEHANENGIVKTFLSANTPGMKCARTIAQGVIGVFVANIDIIVGAYVLDPAQRAIVVALAMAVLSPTMAVIGEADKSVEGEHVAEDSEE